MSTNALSLRGMHFMISQHFTSSQDALQLQITGTAYSCESLRHQLQNSEYDVVLCDAGEANSTQQELLAEWLWSGKHYPKMLWVVFLSPSTLKNWSSVARKLPPVMMVPEVSAVVCLSYLQQGLAGKTAISRPLRNVLEKRPDPLNCRCQALTPRERVVLCGLAQGLSVSEVALRSKRSVKTISGQKQRALQRLGLKSESELYVWLSINNMADEDGVSPGK